MMPAITLEDLLRTESDDTLLNIFDELYACVVPDTGYANNYKDLVNKMMSEGNLCVTRDKYTKIQMSTLSKYVMRELVRRYNKLMYDEGGRGYV